MVAELLWLILTMNSKNIGMKRKVVVPTLTSSASVTRTRGPPTKHIAEMMHRFSSTQEVFALKL